MLAPAVVEVEVLRQSFTGVINGAIRLQVHVFVFHRPPQSLGKDVVETPSARVHTDLYVVVFQDCGVDPARVLDALIRIVDDRHVGEQRVPQGMDAEIRLQGFRQSPSDDVAGEPVENRGEVTESFFQPDVGDVRSPNLVGTGNRKA